MIEIVVEKAAITEYYKIQTDASHASQVATTHIQQIGKKLYAYRNCFVEWGMVRNNLNIALDEEYCEAHFIRYCIYQQGRATLITIL